MLERDGGVGEGEEILKVEYFNFFFVIGVLVKNLKNELEYISIL